MGSDLGRASELIAVAERAQGSGSPDAVVAPLPGGGRLLRGRLRPGTSRRLEAGWRRRGRRRTTIGLSDALIFLGVVLTVGAPEDAREAFDEALSVARADGIPSSLALNLSTVAGYLPIEESERAVSLLDEAIDVGVRCRDHMAITSAIAHKGVISARRGDWRSALAAAADATEPQREMGDVIGLQSTYMLAAAAFSALGDHETAAVVMGKVASIETLTPAFFSADLFAAAEARTRDVLGDQRLADADRAGRRARPPRRRRLPPSGG